jgi:hypothetical protein
LLVPVAPAAAAGLRHVAQHPAPGQAASPAAPPAPAAAAVPADAHSSDVARVLTASIFAAVLAQQQRDGPAAAPAPAAPAGGSPGPDVAAVLGSAAAAQRGVADWTGGSSAAGPHRSPGCSSSQRRRVRRQLLAAAASPGSDASPQSGRGLSPGAGRSELSAAADSAEAGAAAAEAARLAAELEEVEAECEARGAALLECQGMVEELQVGGWRGAVAQRNPRGMLAQPERRVLP